MSRSGSDLLEFEIKPLSNFDLYAWARHMGMRDFEGVFSRKNLPNRIEKACGIVNLDVA